MPQTTPIRSSTEAGLKYCEFMFYTSLATLYRQRETARVLFFHHPGKKDAQHDIDEGAGLAEFVIIP